jgi:hypothetical protein
LRDEEKTVRKVKVFVIRDVTFPYKNFHEALRAKLKEEVFYEEVEIEVIADRCAPGMGTHWLLNCFSPDLDAARESDADVFLVLGETIDCVADWLNDRNAKPWRPVIYNRGDGQYVYCLCAW